MEMFPPFAMPVFSSGLLLCLPLCKLPLALLALEKCLYLREQDTGRSAHLIGLSHDKSELHRLGGECSLDL